jgi:hypothetical protein
MTMDWAAMGFGCPPERKLAPASGVLLYRVWGAGSTEWGSGYFSLEKPASVLDAEMRFNIVDWGNGVHFLSTFRLKGGFPYFVGPVAHGKGDVSRPSIQAFVEPPLTAKLERTGNFEILRHDVSVVQRAGRA